MLHASTLGDGDGCVAICGRSTSGKSTIAAAAGAAGLRVEADDALAFDPSGSRISALTLPFEIRLRPGADEALKLPRVPFRGDGGRELTLAHVVMLEPDSAAAAVGLEAVSPAASFGALMPHAYCFSLEDSQSRIVGEYTSLVERVPTSRLRYPPGHDSLPAMVDALRSLLA